ncbi:flagellar motor stator protein MotA [Desulfatirhabdium butyrativorans]|uniref:flagellar motor stator protein MotA n=1 Tax=Desulfatirhabdium butyrativorans TaxID=340467 RepID=UPI000401A5AF|nr:flagellar motor stator protein MotA [Desulfatirhabdium butyrativorans]
MFVIIGIVVVLGMIVAGYLMEHGNLSVLFQPAEFVIIFGAAIGSFVISNPKKIISGTIRDALKVFTAPDIGKAQYIELLLCLNEIFFKVKREGFLAIEADVDNPHESATFTKYKSVISDHHVMDFICDNFRTIISTNMTPSELEDLMDVDIEAQHHDHMASSEAITRVADALPGLGIVAAVLGVVLTMGKISEPPEVLGHSIGSALVGTFIGILSCYGILGPIGTNVEHKAKAKGNVLNVIKIAIVSTAQGAAPQAAIESARRAVPVDSRPEFNEFAEELKKWKDSQ